VGAFEVAHSRGRALEEFARYADDPVGFIRDVLKGNPWSRQEEIAAALLAHPQVVVRSANGIGKDWLAAQLAIWWAICRRGLVIAQAPTDRQSTEIFMGEVGRAWRRADDLPGELYQRALRLPGEEHAGILSMTSTESSRLTGYHAPRVLIVLSEAQGLDDFAWEAALAVAVGEEDRFLAIGNPLAPSGRFFAASRPGSAWHRLKVSALEHPNVVQGRTVIPGAVTKAAVDRLASEYGVDSPLYAARVLGEFPETGLDTLIPRAWLDHAAQQWERGTLEDRARGKKMQFGVDVARFGSDLSCVAVAEGPILRKLTTWQGADTEVTAGRVVETLRSYNVQQRVPARMHRSLAVLTDPLEMLGRPADVYVDVIGVGAGVADRLRAERWPVTDFNAAAKATEEGRFQNRRAEAYWRVRQQLERGELALLPDEALFEELAATNYTITGAGRIQIEAKADIRQRLGRSPDRADAVVMAMGYSVLALGGYTVDL
jgi:hypothetical protein